MKPIVERYGGEYLVRTEQVEAFCAERNPQRVIVIRFENRQRLDECFASEEYRAIMCKRTNSVESRAVIAEGMD